MAGEQKPSSSHLEQFILLAKGTKGSALPALINQVLEAPGVYVFGDLLDLPTVQEVRHRRCEVVCVCFVFFKTSSLILDIGRLSISVNW